MTMKTSFGATDTATHTATHQEEHTMTYHADAIVKRDGTTFGMTLEHEAPTWAAAYEAVKRDLRAKGFTIVKVRKA